MVLWSITFCEGRSNAEVRRWYATEREADEALHSDPVMRMRRQGGPHKHVIGGKIGLLSFLNAYAN